MRCLFLCLVSLGYKLHVNLIHFHCHRSVMRIVTDTQWHLVHSLSKKKNLHLSGALIENFI